MLIIIKQSSSCDIKFETFSHVFKFQFCSEQIMQACFSIEWLKPDKNQRKFKCTLNDTYNESKNK